MSTKAPDGLEKNDVKKEFKEITERIAELQYVMKAQAKYSLLVIFQGMDSSGKDGATKNVFGECGPDGVNVYSFKGPTKIEFAHDFLWRAHQKVPQKGEIAIFNRSHYEDVLIQRVHKWVDEERVDKRINAINAFEELLEFDNNTKVLKF